MDFMEWLGRQLRQREAWRKNTPLLTVENPYETWNSYIDGLFQDLFEFLVSSDRDLASEYLEYLASSTSPMTKYSLPYQVGYNIFPKGMNTRFKNAQKQQFKFIKSSESGGCQVRVGQKTIEFQMNCDMVKKILNRESFTGNDVASLLPDYNWETEISPLLSFLVVQGVIFVEPSFYS
jgi:hypothetical protein